jgi:hypothetical protein
MSAFGFVVGEDRITIASDGFLWGDEGVQSLQARKVFKVNDRAAFLWLGVGCQALCDNVLSDINQKGVSTPKEIAGVLSKHLQHGFDHPEGKQILERYQFWVLTIGYDPQPVMYLIFSDAPEGAFVPVELPVAVGDIGCRAYDLSPTETNFKALYKLKYFPLYQNQARATKEAFTEMIRSYENEKHVGGEIFTETLKV